MRLPCEVLGVDLEIDDTPCIIDVHFNDGILFVEVARGLNSEKIDLLPYKIKEVLKLYEVTVPKVLIMMTDIQTGSEDDGRLEGFLAAIRNTTGTPLRGIKLLTTSAEVKRSVAKMRGYESLEVAEDITKAMDGLLGVRVSDFIEEGMSTVKQDLLQAGKPVRSGEESIRLSFEGEREVDDDGEKTALEMLKGLRVAVVDDDPVIRELVKATFGKHGSAVSEFENGRVFLDALAHDPVDNHPELVFLDLLMPEADGFTVMAEFMKRKLTIPIIVLSALSKKETVVRAMRAGVKSYMIKPIKPAQILTKTAELLKSNF